MRENSAALVTSILAILLLIVFGLVIGLGIQFSDMRDMKKQISILEKRIDYLYERK